MSSVRASVKLCVWITGWSHYLPHSQKSLAHQLWVWIYQKRTHLWDVNETCLLCYCAAPSLFKTLQLVFDLFIFHLSFLHSWLWSTQGLSLASTGHYHCDAVVQCLLRHCSLIARSMHAPKLIGYQWRARNFVGCILNKAFSLKIAASENRSRHCLKAEKQTSYKYSHCYIFYEK